MTVEIDQSWKIEKTSKPTVLGLSNDKKWAVLVPTAVKRAAFTYLEEKYTKQTLNVMRLFAALIVILVKSSGIRRQRLVIDIEYVGYDRIIRDLIVTLGTKLDVRIRPDDIHFQRIGKHSPAHWVAYDVFSKQRPADRKVTMRDLTTVLP